MGPKRRTHCFQGHELNAENTYVVPKRGNRRCKICTRLNGAAAKTRYRESTEAKSKARSRHLKKEYGITADQYDEMWGQQDGLCAICCQPETRINPVNGKVGMLAVDHCHVTNGVRKLLCHKCNVAIGLLGDNPDRLRAAAAYIESFSICEEQ